MEGVSGSSQRAFASSKIKASFFETGVEPWDPDQLESHVTHSDSTARVRMPAECLARHAVRLAPAVTKELNDLQWERGSMRETQSVFMDACSRQRLAEAELAKEEEEGKQTKRRRRATLLAKRRRHLMPRIPRSKSRGAPS